MGRLRAQRQRLWQNVRRAVSDFVYDEWQSGALAGRKVDEAFFVECDRTTMAQDDIDNGRVVVLVGAAILRPAEFVLIRVTIQTSHCDSRPGTSMG